MTNLALSLGGGLLILWIWVQWGAAFYVQCTGCHRADRIRASLVQHYQPHAVDHAVKYLGWRKLLLNIELSVSTGDKRTVGWSRKHEMPFCPDCVWEQRDTEQQIRHQNSQEPQAPPASTLPVVEAPAALPPQRTRVKLPVRVKLRGSTPMAFSAVGDEFKNSGDSTEEPTNE